MSSLVDIHWQHPLALWLLVSSAGVALLFVIAGRSKRDAARRFAHAPIFHKLLTRTPRHRHVRHAMAWCGWTLTVVGLAGPQWGKHETWLHKRGVDVVLAIDFSKSMLARDVAPSRIERVKAEVAQLLSELDGDRVGVVAFAGESIQFPVTSDYSALLLFVRDLTPYDMPVGGTAIGQALLAAKSLLDRSAQHGQDKVVVLMTDGEDHDRGEHEHAAHTVAEEFAKENIRLYTVSVGSRKPEPIPVHDEFGQARGFLRDDDGNVVTTALTAEGESTLRTLAQSTQGTYFQIRKGASGLNELRKQFRLLKQARHQSRRVVTYDNRVLFALVPAFVLLLAESWVPLSTLAFVLALCGFGITPSSALAWNPLRAADGTVERGNDALRRGESAQALAAYEQAARAHPHHVRLSMNRGLAHLKAKQWDQAREEFQRASEQATSPGDKADAFYNHGVTDMTHAESLASDPEQAAKLYARAEQSFLRSLKARPRHEPAAWNMELARQRMHEARQRAQQQREAQKNSKTDPANDSNRTSGSGAPQDSSSSGTQKHPSAPPDGDDSSPGRDPSNGSPSNQGQPPPRGQAKEGREEASEPYGDRDAVLDALQQSETNLQKHQARRRAAGRDRRVEKDW
jgi:Ca-activated chloride channel family protein